jgi:pyridoxal phosphate enzyme (YggS family)
MSIIDNYKTIKASIHEEITLVVVSKTHGPEKIMEVYNAGGRIFGENKVQELISKQPLLPQNIEWHLIGHLQSNKVKYIAPFIVMIHSIDSLKLLKEVNTQALKNNRIIKCLLQIHIATEETKFGLNFEEAENIITSDELKNLKNINIVGLMGMATNTGNEEQIAKEFYSLKQFFDNLKNHASHNIHLTILSMGMSSDYLIAIKNGSNLIRVGSSIFGNR